MTLLCFNKLEVPHSCTFTAILVSIVLSSSFVNAQNVGGGEKGKDAEILRLRDELRAVERKLDQAIRAGFLPVGDGFASAQEIIKSLPNELELSATKPWDEFQFEQAEAFLHANVVGQQFGAKLSVAKVDIDPNAGATKNFALPKYKIDVLFSPKEFPFQGVIINQQIYHLHPLTFTGDDALAEKARTIKIGKTYELRGVIAELDLKSVFGKPNKKDLRIRLTQVEFEPLEK